MTKKGSVEKRSDGDAGEHGDALLGEGKRRVLSMASAALL
jgi:hypothetical protein